MIAEQQIYLLKSALLPESDAFIFWKKWKDLNYFPQEDLAELRLAIFDSLDYESQKILSQVYYNLRAFAGTDPYLKAIKSNIRYEWVRNQQLWFSLENLTQVLNQRGIIPMLFKGGAAAISFYPDRYIRYLGDMDLFFSENADITVRKVLLEYGCTDAFYFSRKYSPLIFHAAQYTSTRKDDFDVHRYLLHEHLYKHANELLSRERIKVTLEKGAELYIPSITVQMFLTLVHGTRPERYPRLLWMADMYRLMQLNGTKINWNELFSLAEYFKYKSLISEALIQFERVFDINLPKPDGYSYHSEPKELIYYLKHRGSQSNNRLRQVLKSFHSVINIYNLFLKGQVNYTMLTWLYRNYSYRIERNFRRWFA